MSPMDEWKREARDGLLSEVWALHGPNRLIKTTPIESTIKTTARGYVTVERYIIGRSPADLQQMLGLPMGIYASGCRIYRFTRLPRASEVEYELTADHPDGLAFDEASAREEFLRRKLFPERPHKAIYPPGSPWIHQWRLTADLPVVHLLDLAPQARYQYFHR